MAGSDQEQAGLAWQIGVWNQISDIYSREVDPRFEPVVDGLLARASLAAGEQVLDLGTGTGAVIARSAPIVGPSGKVVGVDLSPDMLELARERMDAVGLSNVELREGRAEEIPAGARSFDAIFAGLSMMYVIDRKVGAQEIARVLRSGGRFVAAVWAGPDQCDIVLFQQTAGKFAGTPPVSGVGPGALGDPSTFVEQLKSAGIEAGVETETLGFDFPDFASAWDTLAGVTTAHLPPERQQEAKDAVRAVMYADGDGPRHFRNMTRFIVGERTS